MLFLFKNSHTSSYFKRKKSNSYPITLFYRHFLSFDEHLFLCEHPPHPDSHPQKFPDFALFIFLRITHIEYKTIHTIIRIVAII